MSLVIHLQGRGEEGGGAENNLSSHWGADYILGSSPVHHWATYGDDQPYTRWFIPIVNQPNSQSACFGNVLRNKYKGKPMHPGKRTQNPQPERSSFTSSRAGQTFNPRTRAGTRDSQPLIQRWK